MNHKLIFRYSSIGDNLGLTTIIREMIVSGFSKKIKIETFNNDIFLNNPYLSFDDDIYEDIILEPCRFCQCNIIDNFSKQIGINIQNRNPEIYLTSDEIDFGKNILQNIEKKKLVICSQGGWISKNIPKEKWVDIINELNKYFFTIELGKYDHNYGIIHNVDLNLFNKLSLRESFSVIYNSDVYLGVDTGLFHVSVSFNKPNIVIFRNDGSDINKYHNTISILGHKLCNEKCKEICVYDKENCMSTVDIKDIINEVIKYGI